MTPGYDQGVLDQAGAQVKALSDMHDYAVEQYWRAERAIAKLCEAERSRNRMMVLALVQFFVIVILVAALIARAA